MLSQNNRIKILRRRRRPIQFRRRKRKSEFLVKRHPLGVMFEGRRLVPIQDRRHAGVDVVEDLPPFVARLLTESLGEDSLHVFAQRVVRKRIRILRDAQSSDEGAEKLRLQRPDGDKLVIFEKCATKFVIIIKLFKKLTS